MGSKVEEWMNMGGYDMDNVPSYMKEIVSKLEALEKAGLDAAAIFACGQLMRPQVERLIKLRELNEFLYNTKPRGKSPMISMLETSLNNTRGKAKRKIRRILKKHGSKNEHYFI